MLTVAMPSSPTSRPADLDIASECARLDICQKVEEEEEAIFTDKSRPRGGHGCDEDSLVLLLRHRVLVNVGEMRVSYKTPSRFASENNCCSLKENLISSPPINIEKKTNVLGKSLSALPPLSACSKIDGLGQEIGRRRIDTSRGGREGRKMLSS